MRNVVENEVEAEKPAEGGIYCLSLCFYVYIKKNRSEKFISGLNAAQCSTSVFPNTIIVYCLKTIFHRLYALKRNP